MSETPESRQVFVFDAAIPDLQMLIDAVCMVETGRAPSIIVLDAERDGVLQLADAIAGQSGLDAIHVFSHGSVGSLNLGTAIFDSTALATYDDAIRVIAGTFADTGDLLIYGCNVAHGEAGRAFLGQLATLTGADVAGSSDVTGGTNWGGNWTLEANTGNIETLEVSLDDGNVGVLGTTELLNFTATDVSLWSGDSGYAFNHTFDQLVFSLDPINVSGQHTAEVFGSILGLDYALNASGVQFGLPITVGLSEGVFDLSYPVSAQIGIPAQVRHGDSFSVETSEGVTTNPSLVFDGPSVELSVDAVFKANIAGHLGLTWDLPGLASDSKALWGTVDDHNLFSNSAVSIDKTVGLYDLTLDSSDLDEEWYEGGLVMSSAISKSTQGGRVLYQSIFTLGTDVDLNGLDGAATVVSSDGSQLTDFSASLHQSKPMVFLDVDIDDLIATAITPTNPYLGELIDWLDSKYKIEPGGFGIDLGLR